MYLLSIPLTKHCINTVYQYIILLGAVNYLNLFLNFFYTSFYRIK